MISRPYKNSEHIILFATRSKLSDRHKEDLRSQHKL